MSSDETKKKLRTNRLLKQDFGIESYLECINDKSIRKCISSLRINAHRLRIERGRYVRPKEEIEDRLCLLCNTVEDEVHFLVKCRKYDQKTIGPENAHLKPDFGILSHHEMTLTLNTHTPLLTS